ncbi:biotin--[acetyl-CoA-carboxylase] ligase [Rhodosalinus halophilus]|uniref:biotin--[biotin carboxyl-carrier protein] ligase n=1 Tax=Rhodosalinus halophilus TaxID=2259333 RepID=A0A365UCU2_9RHOB|nr:biotin--[acetyl-CoA-carboxylase] ligase [Rhodosalinus halophilus]
MPAGWPVGAGRLVLDEAPSTMAEAAARAPESAAPLWIMARRQTAGRGRRGRAWADPPGNLAATLLMPAPPPAEAALQSFVAALALFDACVDCTGRAEAFSLKWPNDVLLHGRKLAGILLETLRPAHLAVGIGVNLRHAPEPDTLEPGAVAPVSLAEGLGMDIDAEAFLTPLARAYDARARVLATYGFAPIRTAWLDRAARRGEAVTARTGRDSVTGRFETVDEAGRLILVTPQGRQAIAAADIFFAEGDAHAAGG